MIHKIKSFSIVNEEEADVFLEFPCFFHDPMNVGNLISGSSVFCKPSLYIWKFPVHILLKPILKDFEHWLASMWNKYDYMVVWTFFGIVLLWDQNENWPFPVLWPLLISVYSFKLESVILPPFSSISFVSVILGVFRVWYILSPQLLVFFLCEDISLVLRHW